MPPVPPDEKSDGKPGGAARSRGRGEIAIERGPVVVIVQLFRVDSVFRIVIICARILRLVVEIVPHPARSDDSGPQGDLKRKFRT